MPALSDLKDLRKIRPAKTDRHPIGKLAESSTLKLIAFYFGIPLMIGYYLAVGRVSESQSVSWTLAYYPFRAVLIWMSHCLGTKLFVSFVKPSKKWFVAALIAGWAIGQPFANYFGDLIWQTLYPSSTTDYNHFFYGYASQNFLSARPYLSLIVWIASASFFQFVLDVPLFGFSSSQKTPVKTPEDKLDHKYSPLLSRLPDNLGSDILVVTCEEHYLRIYTRLGDALILYRLSDAVKELGNRGMLVHRSHWVAKSAIVDTKKRGQTSILILSNGIEIPVSRSFRQKALEAEMLPY